MSICALSQRRCARAVVLLSALSIAHAAHAATDHDPANDTMTGADALNATPGARLNISAELVASTDHLDVDFFTIEALAGDIITVRLTRIGTTSDNGVVNESDLNLRLHAYTAGASLVSAPGVGEAPAMIFTPESDGTIYLGVGLACDLNLDGIDDTDPGSRATGIAQVETTTGVYDLEIDVTRQAPQGNQLFFEDFADCEEEVNAYCPPAQTIFPVDGSCLIGSLVKREYPDCEPDTYMVLFDKLNNIINADDNDSTLGNGWASGIETSSFVDNGDGTRSLRIGVTGRPDGLDGVFNGLFLNAPHLQFGEFTLFVQYVDLGGVVFQTEEYTDRFETGAEAFHINYTVPVNAASARINIDNTTGAFEALPDQDLYHIEGLIPYCDYFITQVGGLDCDCRPTDAVMAWVDKSCWVIWDSNEYSAATGYEELTIIADYRGRANFVIAGEDQRDRLLWVGLDLDTADTRAVGECNPPETDIDAGCYTLCFRLAPPHANAGSPMDESNVVGGTSGAVAEMLEAMSHGDINMDGVTNTADLGILIGNFGWHN